MSRNARSNENGRFDDISSNRLNVDGFDDFSEYWSNSSKQNQLGGFDDFLLIFAIFVNADISGHIESEHGGNYVRYRIPSNGSVNEASISSSLTMAKTIKTGKVCRG